MIRVICEEMDASSAVNFDGPVVRTHKTFDVLLPEVEAWLRTKLGYGQRTFVGIEVIDD